MKETANPTSVYRIGAEAGTTMEKLRPFVCVTRLAFGTSERGIPAA
jgi:hypothetical protein